MAAMTPERAKVLAEIYERRHFEKELTDEQFRRYLEHIYERLQEYKQSLIKPRK